MIDQLTIHSPNNHINHCQTNQTDSGPEALFQWCVENGMGYVSFQLPNLKKAWTMVQETTVRSLQIAQVDFQKTRGFLLAPFKQNAENPILFLEPDWVFPSDQINVPAFNQLKNKFTQTVDKQHALQTQTAPLSSKKETYKSLVDSIVNNIKGNQFKKVVASRVKIVKRPEHFSPFDFFEKLKTTYPSAFSFLFYSPQSGCWMGASPEKLLSVSENQLETMALAGTQMDYKKPLEAVTWGEKEQEEQQMVTDFVAQKLENWNGAPVQQSGPYTTSTGKVLHLRTDFTANLKSTSQSSNTLNPLLESLHPTPAVGGLPQKSALAFIEKKEQHNRHFYSGYLGPVNVNKCTNLFVNLRCMQVFSDRLALYLGAGITEQSDPEAEWIETENKARTLLDLL